jgi:hypothetical protein
MTQGRCSRRFASDNKNMGMSLAHLLKTSNFFRQKYWISFRPHRVNRAEQKAESTFPSRPELLRLCDVELLGSGQWVATQSEDIVESQSSDFHWKLHADLRIVPAAEL